MHFPENFSALVTKRIKLSDGKQDMPSIDKISTLPDAIRCHVLSFLPTKLCVATSILSRRWRHVWTDVPNLCFKYVHGKDKQHFDIITSIMLQHKVRCMNTFRVKFKFTDSVVPVDAFNSISSQVGTWIAIAIARDVKKIDINLDLDENDDVKIMLPRYLFTCKTLVDLRLRDCTGIPRDGAVCLPNLKILHLHYIQYKADESLPHLLSGCPMLEDLHLEGVSDQGGLHCMHISSPTIKRLVVIPFHENLRVVINTPIIRYLKVHSPWISARLPTSLTEVDISFRTFWGLDGPYDISVLNTVNSLCNVNCVKLSTCNLQLPDSAFADSNIKFPNITDLHLDADWRFISKFIENADNLQVLRIQKNSYGQDDEDLECWVEPQEAPRCLLSHLRNIRIDDFGYTKNEFDLVKYLLRNAKVLKRMKIYSRNIDSERKVEVLKRILLYPRESTCELVFH